MDAERDTKDWTWVLERPCEQCGFDAGSVGTDVLAGKLRDGATRWSAVLSRDDVRIRPTESQWSPLEYACHVRDVFVIFYGRLALMLEDANPTFAMWDQDEAALEGRYCDQDPAAVRDELCASARRYADRFDTVESAQWLRPGLRSNGSQFTVESLGRYSLHDVVHHLWDVGAPI
ncbi:MAG: DinB family protein [Acidimicrobiales bacterium]